MSTIRNARVQKEIAILEKEPPSGISCWSENGSLSDLSAVIIGPPDTPFSNGYFRLNVHLPERYPFEPPQVVFKTQVYHPNIDTGGRICLDILHMPPKGNWKPSLGLSAVLTSVRLLMSCPNPADPLMAEIAQEYQGNYRKFEEIAKEWTLKYAKQCLELALERLSWCGPHPFSNCYSASQPATECGSQMVDVKSPQTPTAPLNPHPKHDALKRNDTKKKEPYGSTFEKISCINHLDLK